MFIDWMAEQGCGPQHVLADGAAAFNGIDVTMHAIHGDKAPRLIDTAEGKISVRTLQRVSSVHNTPVRSVVYELCTRSCTYMTAFVLAQIERSWRECNEVTAKFWSVFRGLAAKELLDTDDPTDVFCLHQVFLPRIRRDLSMHYGRSRKATRQKTSKNPDAPTGRPSVNYALLASEGHPVSAAEIATLRQLADAYWRPTYSVFPPQSDFEIDPLKDPADRDERARFCDEQGFADLPDETLAFLRSRYLAYRAITRELA